MDSRVMQSSVQQPVTQALEVLPKVATSWAELQPIFQRFGAQVQQATTSGRLHVESVKQDPVTRSLVKFCIPAIHNGRPLGTVMILLFGETKTGKSYTINRLLKQKLCEESEQLDPSRTKDCFEYSVQLLSRKETVRFDLNLVDVPGTCDSEGPNADELNGATIRKFLVTHDLLGQKDGRLTFALPNIVMLTFNAVAIINPAEKSSSFYKTLEALKAAGVVDKDRLNLVIVGTHAMQIPRGKWTEKTENIRKLVAETAKSVLELDPAWEVPVVFVENDPDKEGGYTYDPSQEFVMLPDGTRSHYNLYLALFKLFSTAGDNLGILALGTAWMVEEDESQKQLNSELIRCVRNSPENLTCGPFRTVTLPSIMSTENSLSKIGAAYTRTPLALAIAKRSGLDKSDAIKVYDDLLKVLWRLKYFTEEHLKGGCIQDVENAYSESSDGLKPGERRMLLSDFGMTDNKDALVLENVSMSKTTTIGERVTNHVDDSGAQAKDKMVLKAAWDSWLKHIVAVLKVAATVTGIVLFFV